MKNNVALSNIIANQEIHKKYGGVLPEAASRMHIINIVPVVQEALEKANINLNQLSAIAYTQSPGLIGSLLVGVHFAKGLAQSLQLPSIAVNHLQAHALSNLLNNDAPAFPFIVLTVSGGHTQLILCRSAVDLEVLGQTKDDAAGEAFDKTGKLLGLPYPAGPMMDKLSKEGNPKAFQFSIAKMEDLDFSFSGIKTSVLYFLQKQIKINPSFISENLPDLCASIQHCIVEALLQKLEKAVEIYGIKNVCIAGGVSANNALRTRFETLGAKHQWKTFIPAFQYCTDNAAMIGLVAYYKFLNKQFADWNTIPSARATI